MHRLRGGSGGHISAPTCGWVGTANEHRAGAAAPLAAAQLGALRTRRERRRPGGCLTYCSRPVDTTQDRLRPKPYLDASMRSNPFVQGQVAQLARHRVWLAIDAHDELAGRRGGGEHHPGLPERYDSAFGRCCAQTIGHNCDRRLHRALLWHPDVASRQGPHLSDIWPISNSF